MYKKEKIDSSCPFQKVVWHGEEWKKKLLKTYHHAFIPRRIRQRCTNVHPQFAGMFRSHVIGSEFIALNPNNKQQILTPSCY